MAKNSNRYLRFAELFNEVFDENGNNTLCTRVPCIALINLANELFPVYDSQNHIIDDYYGNPKYGITNPEHLLPLREKIK